MLESKHVLDILRKYHPSMSQGHAADITNWFNRQNLGEHELLDCLTTFRACCEYNPTLKRLRDKNCLPRKTRYVSHWQGDVMMGIFITNAQDYFALDVLRNCKHVYADGTIHLMARKPDGSIGPVSLRNAMDFYHWSLDDVGKDRAVTFASLLVRAANPDQYDEAAKKLEAALKGELDI